MFRWPILKKSNKKIKLSELGSDVKKDLEILLNACKENLRQYDEQLITKAFHWCVDSTKNKVRKNGKPYYTHPLSVAYIVISEIPLDDISVISALLHSIPSGDTYTLNDIRSEFGSTIAEIVEGVGKIQFIEKQNLDHIENYRRLLLSFFKDVRIILIKLAERLDNMRSIEFLPEDKQVQLSRETMEIYAPFAHRFGLGSLKWELEDISFKILNPKEYNEIRSTLRQTREEREEYIRNFTKPVIEHLQKEEIIKNNNITFEILGRPKHIYSIYNKTILREKPVSELYDLFAIRIVLDTEDTTYCYLTYGILTKIYKSVPDTFKDYISNPKRNGYQSIHTAVVGKDNRVVEVQIRTKAMDEIAEKGVAAHFKYKRGFLPPQSVLDDRNLEEWIDLVRNIFENAGDQDSSQLMDSVRTNLFNEEIYVLTPAKEFRVFPKDATPLDFAYSIHTDIGDHCIGAKVNGKVVPMSYKLQNGDQVEILTSKNQKPSNEWLKYAVTQKAQTYIHKFLNENNKYSVANGKKTFEEFLGIIDISFQKVKMDELITFFGFEKPNDFYASFSNGQPSRETIIKELPNFIISNQKNKKPEELSVSETQTSSKNNHTTTSTDSVVKAILNNNSSPLNKIMNVKYAECCYPMPGDKIVGIMKTGMDVTIHRKECRNATNENVDSKSSFINLDWTSLSENNFTSKLVITGGNSINLVNEITSALLATNAASIRGFSFNTNEGDFIGKLTLIVKDQDDLNAFVMNLKAINGVTKVERFME